MMASLRARQRSVYDWQISGHDVSAITVQ